MTSSTQPEDRKERTRRLLTAFNTAATPETRLQAFEQIREHEPKLAAIIGAAAVSYTFQEDH